MAKVDSFRCFCSCMRGVREPILWYTQHTPPLRHHTHGFNGSQQHNHVALHAPVRQQELHCCRPRFPGAEASNLGYMPICQWSLVHANYASERLLVSQREGAAIESPRATSLHFLLLVELRPCRRQTGLRTDSTGTYHGRSLISTSAYFDHSLTHLVHPRTAACFTMRIPILSSCKRSSVCSASACRVWELQLQY